MVARTRLDPGLADGGWDAARSQNYIPNAKGEALGAEVNAVGMLEEWTCGAAASHALQHRRANEINYENASIISRSRSAISRLTHFLNKVSKSSGVIASNSALDFLGINTLICCFFCSESKLSKFGK